MHRTFVQPMRRSTMAAMVGVGMFRSTRVNRFRVSIGADDDEPDEKRALEVAAAEALRVQKEQRDIDNAQANNAIQDNTSQVIKDQHGLLQMEKAIRDENDTLTVPKHPDTLVPAYTKVKAHQKQVRVMDIDKPEIQQKASFVRNKPGEPHPWVEGCLLEGNGDLTHGDGYLGVAGNGEVGFEEGKEWTHMNKHARGFYHRSLVGLTPPEKMGKVIQDIVIKHSLNLTGRGMFATREIKKGELIMMVRSTASSLGYNSKWDRLIEMMVDIIKQVQHGSEDDLEFLHTWILHGQMSSLVECWPEKYTAETIRRLGGRQVLDKLELHPLHISRLAAIIDMNAFVVDGMYNEDRGKAYFPEASFLNHSCVPNADYEILTQDEFLLSEYNERFRQAMEKHREEEAAEAEALGKNPQADKEEEATDQFFELFGLGKKEKKASKQVEEEAKAAEAFARMKQAAAEFAQEKPDGVKSIGDGASSSGPTAEGVIRLDPDVRNARNTGHFPSPVARATETLLTETGEEPISYDEEIEQALAMPKQEYLFCCRADRDIAKGEEVLISYVPSDWRHDNRQYVLRDKYKFNCRCPKCSPIVEWRGRYWARIFVMVILIWFALQLIVYKSKEDAVISDQQIEQGNPLPHTHRYYN